MFQSILIQTCNSSVTYTKIFRFLFKGFIIYGLLRAYRLSTESTKQIVNIARLLSLFGINKASAFRHHDMRSTPVELLSLVCEQWCTEHGQSYSVSLEPIWCCAWIQVCIHQRQLDKSACCMWLRVTVKYLHPFLVHYLILPWAPCRGIFFFFFLAYLVCWFLCAFQTNLQKMHCHSKTWLAVAMQKTLLTTLRDFLSHCKKLH